MLIPISESGRGCAELRDKGRPFSGLCRDFLSFPRHAEC